MTVDNYIDDAWRAKEEKEMIQRKSALDIMHLMGMYHPENTIGVWNDAKIKRWADAGGCTNYDPKLVNGASIDLELSDMVCFPQENYDKPILRYGDKSDMAKVWRPSEQFNHLLFYPGQALLLSTRQRTKLPSNACAWLNSKSTAGRCLIEHCHSGFGDPGFNGHWTLEVINLSSVVWDLRPGDRLVQMIIVDLVDDAVNDYTITGRYQNQGKAPEAPKGW